MYVRACFFAVISLLWLTSTWASTFVVTDTHFYKINSNGYSFDGTLYVTNIQTNVLTRIQVGKNPIGIYLHGRQGYVPNATSRTITVIDLNTHKVIKTITLIEPNGQMIQDMVIEGSKAYIQFYESRHLQIIDLDTDTVTTCIDLPQTVHSFTIYGDILYAVHSYTKSISYLWLGSKLTKEVFHMTETPKRIIVNNPDYAYVLTHNHSIVVLDLTNHRCHRTIQLSGIPQDMVFGAKRAYVTVVDTMNGLNSFTCIDLSTYKVAKELKLDQKPGKIKTSMTTAFVTADNNKHVWVIDLVHFQIYRHFRNPKNMDLYFSDAHLYKSSSVVHAEMEIPLDSFYIPVLFDNPYPGITGDLWEDGESAYTTFVNAMTIKGCPKAKEHLDKALAGGNPKAYAYAAYAILHELFGATWDYTYYQQFYVFCDKTVYDELVDKFKWEVTEVTL